MRYLKKITIGIHLAKKKKPIMVDIILEKSRTDKIYINWDSMCDKSSLIEEGYESEFFFQELGKKGNWLFYTNSPIKTSYNSVIAVIKSFWNLSVVKQSEKERKRHTNKLANLCSIYTSLNSLHPLKLRIQNAIEEIRKLINSNKLCLYMPDNNENLNLQYFNSCKLYPEFHNKIKKKLNNEIEIIKQVSKGKKLIVIKKNFKKKTISEIYLPILLKYKKSIGVIKLTKESEEFLSDDLNLLDLIVNRIGITIENNLLQEELKRKSDFQSKLIKNANDAIITTDKKWNTVIFNPAAKKIFKHCINDFSSSNNIKNFFPKKSIEILSKKDFICNKENDNDNISNWYEMHVISKKTESIPVKFSCYILREYNKMIGTVSFFQDLREIKSLEKKIVQSEKLAEVGQTVAGMAHCIKNILHGFNGGRYIMNIGMNKNDIDKIKNGWEIIQRNINRTSNLVLDLLSYSKNRKPEYELCDPNEIIKDIYNLFIGLALEHNIKFKINFSKKINYLFLDPKTIHRCITNLVANAIDACLFDKNFDKKHKIVLKTKIKEKRLIQFIIEDNGCGMSNEVKSKIFLSLFSTKGSNGTGLGLLVTAKLIEEHGGSLKVISARDKGTTFTITFPINLKNKN